MSRCATTASLLDAAFGGRDLTRDEAAHAQACPECAHALALQRRFDSDLGAVAQDLAPVHAGPIHELIDLVPSKEKSIVTWRSGFIGAAAVAGIVVAVVITSFVGDGSAFRDVGRILGLRVDTAEAAAAFGVSEEAVVSVGRDALGLKIEDRGNSAQLHLLLLDSEDRKVRQLYEQRLDIPPGSGGLFTEPVRCFGVMDRDLYVIVAMGWPAPGARAHAAVGGIDAEAAEVADFGTVGGRVGALLAADADSVDPERTRITLRIGGGESRNPLAHLSADCAEPSTATCGRWSSWSPATRESVTEWLVETRLEAVRSAQQLPSTTPEDEIVAAATSSIDKNCQGSGPDTRLTEIVERLYD